MMEQEPFDFDTLKTPEVMPEAAGLDIRAVANDQKMLIKLILIKIGLLVARTLALLGVGYPSDIVKIREPTAELDPSVAMISLAFGIAVFVVQILFLVYLVRLGGRLSISASVLVLVCVFVVLGMMPGLGPCFSILDLLLILYIVRRASSTLQQAGLPVGLFGVRRKDLMSLQH